MKIRYDRKIIWSGKGLNGEMFSRGSLHGGIVQSGNCPVGKMPVDVSRASVLKEVSVGKLSTQEIVYNRTDKYSQQSSIIWQVWINA